TNRTVVTLVGTPDACVEACFHAIKKAGELIDMSNHKGAHPRMGATDVCPFIPISGITMAETAKYAHQLAERVGKELKIPVYLYEYAQKNPTRKNLSIIREGEYEGFFKKIKLAEWKPDFGSAEYDAKRGATVIGARDFLVAYNVNLNTTSVRRANSVAFDVREAGRKTNDVVHPGACKSVKGIGWFIKEYGIAQVSMNLTNINITPVHVAFEECVKSANNRGMRVTGSELVGLIPLESLLDAGKYFLKKQNRSAGVSEKELIKIAVKSLGLDELTPFKPEERIIEYQLKDKNKMNLTGMSLSDFADETASESPAPGGGSISAYIGALGISLGTMVANLSSHKKGWDEHWEEFSKWAEKGQKIKEDLLKLVDEDTNAFNKIMSAFGLSKASAEEKTEREKAIQSATKYATEIPFRVMQLSYESMEVIKAMVEKGNPNSVSDAGVGALCARSAVMGSYLNVKINAKGLTDKKFARSIVQKGKRIEEKAKKSEAKILGIVRRKI
ncbi:MAG: glutamate formimidoyltransferase, partial [Bacteroidota bacterium]